MAEIRVYKGILEGNQAVADTNRALLADLGIHLINVMASPGAGKTSLILALARLIDKPVGVIEGDIASSIDAEAMEAANIPVVQINTGGGCHLDARMIADCLPALGLGRGSIAFVENVGNLVCPAEFDLGESTRLVVASYPEGHDKPYKYIGMFKAADAIVLNKLDLASYVPFDRALFDRGLLAINPTAPVFACSCVTGEGLGALTAWIENRAPA